MASKWYRIFKEISSGSTLYWSKKYLIKSIFESEARRVEICESSGGVQTFKSDVSRKRRDGGDRELYPSVKDNIIVAVHLELSVPGITLIYGVKFNGALSPFCLVHIGHGR